MRNIIIKFIFNGLFIFFASGGAIIASGLSSTTFLPAEKANEGKQTKTIESYSTVPIYSSEDMYNQLFQIQDDIRNNDIIEADFHLARLLEDHADNERLPDEIYNLAVNCVLAGKDEFAVLFYRQLIYTWPKTTQACYALCGIAIEYSKLGDEEKARLTIEKLKNNYSGVPQKRAECFYRLGQYYREDKKMVDYAAELYEYAVNKCPKDNDFTMLSLVEMVKYYIHQGKFVKAGEQYKKLTTLYTNHPLLVSNICFIGDSYLSKGDYNSAKNLYNNVIKNWPNDPKTIFAKAGLAKIAANVGRDADANQIIDGIFADYADNPDIADAVQGIGEQYWNMALSEYRLAHSERTGRGQPMFNDTCRAYYIKAQAVWEKSINKLPVSPDISTTYRMAAEACRSSRQFEKALQYYKAFVENWPDNEAASHCQFMICSLYQSLKGQGIISEDESYELTKKAYEKLVRDYPKNSQTGTVRAYLNEYEMKNKPEEVPQTIEEAIELIDQYKQRKNKVGLK